MTPTKFIKEVEKLKAEYQEGLINRITFLITVRGHLDYMIQEEVNQAKGVLNTAGLTRFDLEEL